MKFVFLFFCFVFGVVSKKKKQQDLVLYIFYIFTFAIALLNGTNLLNDLVCLNMNNINHDVINGYDNCTTTQAEWNDTSISWDQDSKFGIIEYNKTPVNISIASDDKFDSNIFSTVGITDAFILVHFAVVWMVYFVKDYCQKLVMGANTTWEQYNSHCFDEGANNWLSSVKIKCVTSHKRQRKKRRRLMEKFQKQQVKKRQSQRFQNLMKRKHQQRLNRINRRQKHEFKQWFESYDNGKVVLTNYRDCFAKIHLNQKINWQQYFDNVDEFLEYHNGIYLRYDHLFPQYDQLFVSTFVINIAQMLNVAADVIRISVGDQPVKYFHAGMTNVLLKDTELYRKTWINVNIHRLLGGGGGGGGGGKSSSSSNGGGKSGIGSSSMHKSDDDDDDDDNDDADGGGSYSSGGNRTSHINKNDIDKRGGDDNDDGDNGSNDIDDISMIDMSIHHNNCNTNSNHNSNTNNSNSNNNNNNGNTYFEFESKEQDSQFMNESLMTSTSSKSNSQLHQVMTNRIRPQTQQQQRTEQQQPSNEQSPTKSNFCHGQEYDVTKPSQDIYDHFTEAVQNIGKDEYVKRIMKEHGDKTLSLLTEKGRCNTAKQIYAFTKIPQQLLTDSNCNMSIVFMYLATKYQQEVKDVWIVFEDLCLVWTDDFLHDPKTWTLSNVMNYKWFDEQNEIVFLTNDCVVKYLQQPLFTRMAKNTHEQSKLLEIENFERLCPIMDKITPILTWKKLLNDWQTELWQDPPPKRIKRSKEYKAFAKQEKKLYNKFLKRFFYTLWQKTFSLKTLQQDMSKVLADLTELQPKYHQAAIDLHKYMTTIQEILSTYVSDSTIEWPSCLTQKHKNIKQPWFGKPTNNAKDLDEYSRTMISIGVHLNMYKVSQKIRMRFANSDTLTFHDHIKTESNASDTGIIIKQECDNSNDKHDSQLLASSNSYTLSVPNTTAQESSFSNTLPTLECHEKTDVCDSTTTIETSTTTTSTTNTTTTTTTIITTTTTVSTIGTMTASDKDSDLAIVHDLRYDDNLGSLYEDEDEELQDIDVKPVEIESTSCHVSAIDIDDDINAVANDNNENDAAYVHVHNNNNNNNDDDYKAQNCISGAENNNIDIKFGNICDWYSSATEYDQSSIGKQHNIALDVMCKDFNNDTNVIVDKVRDQCSDVIKSLSKEHTSLTSHYYNDLLSLSIDEIVEYKANSVYTKADLKEDEQNTRIMYISCCDSDTVQPRNIAPLGLAKNNSVYPDEIIKNIQNIVDDICTDSHALLKRPAIKIVNNGKINVKFTNPQLTQMRNYWGIAPAELRQQLRRQAPFVWKFIQRHPWGIQKCITDFVHQAISGGGGLLMIPFEVEDDNGQPNVVPACCNGKRALEFQLPLSEYDMLEFYKGSHFLSIKTL